MMAGLSMAIEAALIVETARGWLGTPYLHQASLKGVGTDCLGLVRGVWRELAGSEPEAPPAYAPDWGEASGAESLLDAARRHLVEIKLSDLSAGDVVLFRMVATSPAKHCGILGERNGSKTLVHAWSRHRVAEVPFDRAWQRRLAFAFRFPDVL